jgi:hypothetical protein
LIHTPLKYQEEQKIIIFLKLVKWKRKRPYIKKKLQFWQEQAANLKSDLKHGF